MLAVLIYSNLRSPFKKVEHKLRIGERITSPQFRRSFSNLLGTPLVSGNRVTALNNGSEIFPAMLEAIRGAKKTVTFETYIYWSGEVGKQFTEALSARARAGVKVHLLLDWLGSSKINDSDIEEMERAGVEVERYNPIRWYNVSRLNNRTHRKILVVDGKVGFTGGVGIADIWSGDADSPDHWRELHFKIEGPVVAQLQTAFMDNWLKVRPEVHHNEDYFPPLQTVGDVDAQVFKSSPNAGSDGLRLMYLLAIAAAQDSIYICNSYFVPDEITIEELVKARKRGVKVEIIVPGEHIDTEIVRKASRGLWDEMLRAGIEIYEYQPTMHHGKIMIIDKVFVSVGSTNFDERSFRLNNEANLNLFGGEFAVEQIETFEQDKKLSKRISLNEWQARPLREKVLEKTSLLIRSQL